MIDPSREEARVAVGKCKSAGIRPVMITGDHPATALAVARQAGIAREQDTVVSGAQLDALSDEELPARSTRFPFTRASRPSTSCGWSRRSRRAAKSWP